MRRVFLLLLFLCGSQLYGVDKSSGANGSELFDQGMNSLTGAGPGRSDVQALDYFRRSAELGFAPAQVVLGYLHDTGRIASLSHTQAAEWYEKAAQQDDPLGEWLLGELIYNGQTSLRDLNEASLWLQKSAAHGNPFAEYMLGQIKLERGDYANAATWFRKAAVQGLPQAQQQLGFLLKQGRGVNEDKFEAYTWLLVSLDAGNRRVTTDLQQLEGELGSRLTEQAKNKARELEGSVTRAAVSRGCTGWSGELDVVPSPPPPDLQRFCR